MEFTDKLIAPCGVNCGVCIGYLREKNKCCGCLDSGSNKPAHCLKCGKKFCDEHNKVEFTYCYECHKFPCVKIKNLSKRYVEKYQCNLIENGKFIQQYCIEEFLNQEKVKWKCKNCGEILSVHRSTCLNCGKEYR